MRKFLRAFWHFYFGDHETGSRLADEIGQDLARPLREYNERRRKAFDQKMQAELADPRKARRLGGDRP